MVLLNIWVLFAFIPLFMLHRKLQNSRQSNLIYLTLIFLIIAVARPALKNSFSNEKFNSQNYIIAIDASYSMQADDLKPTRYTVAKEAIKKLLLMHLKDRFTLFAFTSNALLISPPTTDSTISIQALDALNPQYILTKSTNLNNLFKTIAKIPAKKKNLIIFSDGGDEHDTRDLVTVLKKNSITPYIVATASQKGVALIKNGKYLKDYHSSLVISKINPSLKDIARLGGGKYYELTSPNIVNKLSDDLTQQKNLKQEKIKLQSYRELFFIPLSIGVFLFFIAVTKLHQLYIFIPLLLFPYKISANLLDFYHIKEANGSFLEKNYREAAKEFKKIEPSVKSYYNIATAYYKAGQYKNALKYYAQIKTANREIKQAIFYNMGNSCVKLKAFNRAKIFYINALALGYDKDALYNLNLIRGLKTEVNASDLLPHKESKNKKKSSESKSKQKNKKENKKGASSSNRSSEQSSNGSGDHKQKKKNSLITEKKKNQSDNYKMGYKAYEIINKGYTDEKEPW